MNQTNNKMKASIKILLLIAIIVAPLNSFGQIKVDFKKKILNQTNSRANQAADKAVSKSLDAVENGAKDAVSGDDNNADNQNQAKDEKASTSADSQANQGNKADAKAGEKPAAQEQASLQTYSKYDFIPGEKIIFYEDFTQDAVGDFPAAWNTNESAEVVTTNLFPGNWLKFDTRAAIWTDGLLTFPENYTIEFDIVPVKSAEGQMTGYAFRLMESKNKKSYDGGGLPGEAGVTFYIEYFGRQNYRTYFNMPEGDGLGLSGSKDDEPNYQKVNKKYHIAFWVQKTRIRIYQDQVKVFDLPKALTIPSVKFDRIRFEDGAAMVTNIRIAIGAPDMRNKLLTEGKLVSYGIYFDVNKDVVKPESYSTLKTIAGIMTENPDLKVKIVGYTDSDGADAANLDLSKRRGASVKNELVKTFGIDASRLESDGMGEAQPIAPNDTQANKALNRRVEFIKL
jgi:OOP family OmpA-OmpF porin